MKIILNGSAQYINDDLTLQPGGNEITDEAWAVLKSHTWIKSLLSDGNICENERPALPSDGKNDPVLASLKREKPKSDITIEILPVKAEKEE